MNKPTRAELQAEIVRQDQEIVGLLSEVKRLEAKLRVAGAEIRILKTSLALAVDKLQDKFLPQGES